MTVKREKEDAVEIWKVERERWVGRKNEKRRERKEKDLVEKLSVACDRVKTDERTSRLRFADCEMSLPLNDNICSVYKAVRRDQWWHVTCGQVTSYPLHWAPFNFYNLLHTVHFFRCPSIPCRAVHVTGSVSVHVVLLTDSVSVQLSCADFVMWLTVTSLQIV